MLKPDLEQVSVFLSTTYNGEMTHRKQQKQAVREAATICPASCELTFDLLTLKIRPDVFDIRQTRIIAQCPCHGGRDIIMNGDITLAAPRQCQRASEVLSPFTIFAVFDV